MTVWVTSEHAAMSPRLGDWQRMLTHFCISRLNRMGMPKWVVFLDMLGVFTELETNPRRERQLEGIAAPERHLSASSEASKGGW